MRLPKTVLEAFLSYELLAKELIQKKSLSNLFDLTCVFREELRRISVPLIEESKQYIFYYTLQADIHQFGVKIKHQRDNILLEELRQIKEVYFR